MNLNRNLRVCVALLLLAGVASTLLPYATSYVATSAVVNAPLVSLRAPFDGRMLAGPPRFATPVRPGDILGRVRNERQDLRDGADLQARGIEIVRAIAALRQEIASLAELDADLAGREARFRAQVLDANLVLQRQILASLRANRARGVEIALRLRRSRTLASGGAVAAATLDGEGAELAVNRAETSRLAALLEDARLERRGIEAGVVPRLSGNSNDYQRQRRDEIAMRRAGLAAELTRLSAQQEGLGLRQATAGQREAALRDFAALAPMAGVVWQTGPAVGTEILAGAEVVKVLDCGRRFLEVTVPERYFESIRPGTAASVRLLGGEDLRVLPVAAVMGSGVRPEYPELAAEPKDVPEGQLRVLIRLDPPEEIAEAAGTFCDVGRTAEVRFDRSLESDLRPLRRIKTSVEQLIAALWPAAALAAPRE